MRFSHDVPGCHSKGICSLTHWTVSNYCVILNNMVKDFPYCVCDIHPSEIESKNDQKRQRCKAGFWFCRCFEKFLLIAASSNLYSLFLGWILIKTRVSVLKKCSAGSWRRQKNIFRKPLGKTSSVFVPWTLIRMVGAYCYLDLCHIEMIWYTYIVFDFWHDVLITHIYSWLFLVKWKINLTWISLRICNLGWIPCEVFSQQRVQWERSGWEDQKQWRTESGWRK